MLGKSSLGLSECNQNPKVDQLTCLTYAELRRLAAGFLNSERVSHTLQPTALVHEAYLKLAAQKGFVWTNKGQFLSVAARCMRRILVDHARNRGRQKRGGQQQTISLDDMPEFSNQQSSELLCIDEAVTRLAKFDARQASIVELRFYGGLSVEETATVLNISPKTVKRDWSVAKAWLYGELKEWYGAEARAVETGQDPI
jgi:RNA polymerase sigma-70 factor, ECF subfamily